MMGCLGVDGADFEHCVKVVNSGSLRCKDKMSPL